MGHALKNVPVTELPVPEGIVNQGGEWYYDEYAKGAGVSSVWLSSGAPAPGVAGVPTPGIPISVLPPADEKRRILDLFKN
jgi:penicillin-binding protein 1A